VAGVDSWDDHLEAATVRLEDLTSGRRSGRLFIAQAEGWRAEIRGQKRSVWMQVTWQGDPAALPQLDDYRLVLAYGLSFHTPDPGRPSSFTKQLNIQEGYKWEEQTLREVVLELLGLMRHVLGVGVETTLAFDDQTRTGPSLSLAREKMTRRRR
jgi:hypothetical protein